MTSVVVLEEEETTPATPVDGEGAVTDADETGVDFAFPVGIGWADAVEAVPAVAAKGVFILAAATAFVGLLATSVGDGF